MEGINDASSGQPAYAAARFSSDRHLAEVPPWDPGSGSLVVGVDLSQKQFVAKMPVGLLVALVRDPARNDITPDQGGAGHPYRAMSSANRRNIQPYVNYILERVPTADAGLDDEQDGALPPVILWSEELLEIRRVMLDGGATIRGLVVPHHVQLEALDGRTQVAAWHQVAASNRYTRDITVAVVIHHGRLRDWATRVFLDLQTHGVRSIPTSWTADADPVDTLFQRVKDGVPAFRDRISPRRQLGPEDDAVLTESALRTACATFVLGIGGVQKTAQTKDALESAHDDEVQQKAVYWFTQLAEAFSDQLQPSRRKDTILSTPAAMAALGAVGHQLTHGKDYRGAVAAIALRIGDLKDVRWERGPHWNGIAGRIGSTGLLSVGGGAREHAYDIFRALYDRNSAEYGHVRGQNETRTR